MVHTSPTASADGSARRERQLHDLRFLETLQDTLAGCADEVALYSSAVHRVVAGLDVESACLASHNPIAGTIEVLQTAGTRRSWDAHLLRRVVEERRTLAYDGVLAAPLLSSNGT